MKVVRGHCLSPWSPICSSGGQLQQVGVCVVASTQHTQGVSYKACLEFRWHHNFSWALDLSGSHEQTGSTAGSSRLTGIAQLGNSCRQVCLLDCGQTSLGQWLCRFLRLNRECWGPPFFKGTLRGLVGSGLPCLSTAALFILDSTAEMLLQNAGTPLGAVPAP